MIAQNLHRLKVEKSDQCLTSYAGLPLLSELAHQTGLVEQLDAIPGLWQRQGCYRTSDYIMSLAMTLIAGGEGLDDTRLLRCDPGLNQLTFPTMPAANTFGEFLRRFGHRSLHHLSRTVSGLARQQYRRQRAADFGHRLVAHRVEQGRSGQDLQRLRRLQSAAGVAGRTECIPGRGFRARERLAAKPSQVPAEILPRAIAKEYSV